jgi:hypothetical protein
MKAEQLKFIKASLVEALDEMKPALIAASARAHKLEEMVDPSEEEINSAQVEDLGWVVRWATDLCPPDLFILRGIAQIFSSLQDGDENSSKPSETKEVHQH